MDGGCLWGRGAEDCKSVLTAEMDAVEELLEEGFAPDFDIYLSFGHNEEVQCTPDKKGSVLTAAYLKEQGIHLACLFDEGGNVEEGRAGEPPLALVGMRKRHLTNLCFTRTELAVMPASPAGALCLAMWQGQWLL